VFQHLRGRLLTPLIIHVCIIRWYTSGMDAREKIARNVRELREQRDLTQTQLAEKAGVNTMTVSRTERGEHAPSTNTLVRLAEALNVPLSALLD